MKISNLTDVIVHAFAANVETTTENSLGRFGGQRESLLGGTSDNSGTGMGRRYTDLLRIVQHFTPGFDERKYWAYGCNCLMLGDRPISEMGKGKPVDELDTVCRNYKQCQKCVREEYGQVNFGKFLKYIN